MTKFSKAKMRSTFQAEEYFISYIVNFFKCHVECCCDIFTSKSEWVTDERNGCYRFIENSK